MAFSQQTYQGQGIVQNRADNRSGQILGENIRTAADIIAEAVGKKAEEKERNKIIEGTNAAMEKVRSLHGIEDPEGYGDMGLREKAAYNEFFLTSELPEIRRQQKEAEMQEQYGKAAQTLGLPEDLHPELFPHVLRGQQQQAQNAAMLQRLQLQQQMAEDDQQFRREYQERQLATYNQPKGFSLADQIKKFEFDKAQAEAARDAALATREGLRNRVNPAFHDEPALEELINRWEGRDIDGFEDAAAKRGWLRAPRAEGDEFDDWLNSDEEPARKPKGSKPKAPRVSMFKIP